MACAGLQAVYPSLIRLSEISGLTSLLSAIQWEGIILFVALYFLIKKFKKHPIVWIAASAVTGVAFQFAS